MEQNASALPKVTLGQYKGLDFIRRVRPVSEKAVELEASNLTRTHAPFVPVELPAARGMRVTLDFEGFLDGAPIPDSRMENVTVVLGTGQLMPAAENAVYGHKAGEDFQFDFTYPAEFRVPELSGKTAQFAITLHTVEQKQPVPLDDAFAKTLGFDTVDALKESIREKKRRSHEANADRIAGAALLDMAGANLTAELDNAILDQNADHDMNALRDRLRRSKMTMELYCKAGQTTPDGCVPPSAGMRSARCAASLRCGPLPKQSRSPCPTPRWTPNTPALPSCTTLRSLRSAKCSAGTLWPLP